MTSSAMNDAQKALMKDVIRVYFSGGEDVAYKSVGITSATTVEEVTHMMMEKINTHGFGNHFEVIEIVKGKEHKLKGDEKVMDVKNEWTGKGWNGKKLDDPDFRLMLVFKQESIKALDAFQKGGNHSGEKVDTGSQANLLAGLQAGKISAAALEQPKPRSGSSKIVPSVSREEAAAKEKAAVASSATLAPPAAAGGASGSVSPRNPTQSQQQRPIVVNQKVPSVISKELPVASLSAETKAIVDLLKALIVSANSTEPVMSTEVFDPAAHPEPSAPAAVAATSSSTAHEEIKVALVLPEVVAAPEPKKQEENAFMNDLDSMLANLAKATAELDN